MTLINKLNAHNPSWDELMNFLKSNHVEDIPYELDKWICADYAETIHNQAEYAGIKAGVVVTGISLFTHAFNVFETTDKGFVYIDCTPGEDCEALDFDDIAHTYKLVGLYSHEQYYDINGYSPFFSQLWVVW
ncbi:hypothetical protein B1774_04125 [Dehalococcoides mccartyi]|nr:hypothetical protein B1773_04480 [Dehalococcoides mccartyi]AQU04600.1 hypothetical protein B1774_04125 [Dehalococcoides mccartyi]